MRRGSVLNVGMMTIVPVALPIATFLIWTLGWILCVRGFRGVRVGDHSYCAACQYDLYGIVAPNCPECGRRLTDATSTVVGQRRRSNGWIALGVALVLGTSLALGSQGWHYVQENDWQTSKPVWYLLREAGQRPNHAAAMKELLRRLDAGELSRQQIDSIAADALRAQADLSQSWDADWGDFVESARAWQTLSDAQWKQYQAEALRQISNTVTVSVRQAVRRRDPLPVLARLGQVRLGPGHARRFQVECLVSISGDLLAVQQPTIHWMEYLQGPHENHVMLARMTDDEVITALDGDRSAQIAFCASIYEQQKEGASTQPTSTETFRFTRRWTLLSEGVDSIELVSGADIQAALSSSVGMTSMDIDAFGKCTIEFRSQGVTIPLACDVIVRSADVDTYLSPILLTGRNARSIGRVDRLRSQRIDVVLKPNLWHARQTVDITRMWGEPLIFPNISTERFHRPLQSSPSPIR